MAKHTITINPLDPSSVRRAQVQLEKIMQDFQKKCAQFMQEVANLGVGTAKDAFGSSVKVEAIPMRNGFKIVASGENIGFLEFGAGTMTNADMFAQEVSYEVSPGSWSRTEGSGEFARTGKWHFGGKEYEYVMPRHGMANAYESISLQAADIAKKVFG